MGKPVLMAFEPRTKVVPKLVNIQIRAADRANTRSEPCDETESTWNDVDRKFIAKSIVNIVTVSLCNLFEPFCAEVDLLRYTPKRDAFGVRGNHKISEFLNFVNASDVKNNSK